MQNKLMGLLLGTTAIAAVSFVTPTNLRPMSGADNSLTAAEKKAGWELLFDGKSTTNWRPYKNAESDGWEIVNGELHCKDKDVKHRADLITKEEYADFELAFDWKVGKAAN